MMPLEVNFGKVTKPLEVVSHQQEVIEVKFPKKVVWGALPTYYGEHEITPLAHKEQCLETANKTLQKDIKIKKIPYFEVSNNSGGTTVTIGIEV